ncbi:MAG: hypothetical protein H6737_18910 [Alphaproteobacteria bacterium]|nr:hypothetical protein [Alphaproteobacteria bacterium]
MTGAQGLALARGGLLFNSGLGLLLAAVLLLTAPVMVLEGEDIGALIVGLVIAAISGAVGLVGLGLAATLDRPLPRLLARALGFVQFLAMFCFCGVLPLFGTVAVWIGLLVADREGG